MHIHENLIKKQFSVSRTQIDKIEAIATYKGTSAAEIVRMAIDVFDPDLLDTMHSGELMQLVSQQLKEAVASTQAANEQVACTLDLLNKGHH